MADEKTSQTSQPAEILHFVITRFCNVEPDLHFAGIKFRKVEKDQLFNIIIVTIFHH